MSNVIEFPTPCTIQDCSTCFENKHCTKQNFSKTLEAFHTECNKDFEKTEKYRIQTAKKHHLREMLITKYNVDEILLDDLLEITVDLVASEYDYMNFHIPELFFVK